MLISNDINESFTTIYGGGGLNGMSINDGDYVCCLCFYLFRFI